MPKRGFRPSIDDQNATLIVMDYQGGGSQTGPRHVHGAAGGTERDPVRGFPPGRGPQPSPDGYSQSNGYSPVSGYQLPIERIAVPAPAGRSGKRRSRLLRRPVLFGSTVAVVVMVLAAAGTVLYAHYERPHPSAIHPGASLRLPTSDATAGSPLIDKKLGRWQHIGTRKLDPAPLTANELYPPAFMPPGSTQYYTRAAASLDKDCTLAVFGTQLQTALQTGKCTQVVRATYLSGDGKMMGTIGVANLSTAAAAQQAGQATGADELIAPLSTSKGPAKNMLSGTGLVYAEVKGHYLILMYAEFTSLKSPSTAAQKQQLLDFAKGMFVGSANVGLSHRMLGSKPV